MDQHKNFASSIVTAAPSPANSGGTMTIANGSRFPIASNGNTATWFNVTVCQAGVEPDATNSEIVRVQNTSGNIFSIQRAVEGSTARSIVNTDRVFLGVTAKTLTDIEAGAVAADVQFYFAGDDPGTWVKSASAKWVEVICVGGGGGGGSGACYGSGVIRGGGGGGSSGVYFQRTFAAQTLPSSCLVAAGLGGSGGGAVSSGDGNDGVNGILSYFGDVLLAPGGVHGNKGTSSAGGSGGIRPLPGYSSSGGAGGASSTSGQTPLDSTAIYGSGGGGGGGGISSTNLQGGGGGGGAAPYSNLVGGAGGLSGTTGNGNPGNSPTMNLGYGCPTGGSGGGGASRDLNPGSGGSLGSLFDGSGAGGGGGGASTTGHNSAAGAAGGNGVVIVVTHS